MFRVDTHCDTLSTLRRGGELINAYNTSKTDPFLQFYAVFVGEDHASGEAQFRRAASDLLAFHRAWRGALVKDKESLEKALAAPKSALLTLEGGDAAASEKELSFFYEAGVRVINPTWNFPNHLAASCAQRGAEDFGFTQAGERFLSSCREKGILIDASHLSDRGFWHLVRRGLPFLASHSNCRALCPHPRNLEDDQIRALIDAGGFMGLNLYPAFLREEGEVTLRDLLPHAHRVLSLGGEDHLGLGFDIDGVGDSYPRGILPEESIQDQALEIFLPEFGREITEKIFGKNALAFLYSAW